METEANPPLPKRCASCTKPGTHLCSECKGVLYCSRKCQKQDWRAHKHLCKTFKDFQIRPHEHAHRVVYFGQNAEKPVWMWLHVRNSMNGRNPPREGQLLWINGKGREVRYVDHEDLYDEDDFNYKELNCIVDCKEWLNNGFSQDNNKPIAAALYIEGNPLLEIKLEATITVWHDSTFVGAYPHLNTAVLAATRNHPNAWAGPFIASLGKTTQFGDTPRIKDMTMQAYSDVVAHFKASGDARAIAY